MAGATKAGLLDWALQERAVWEAMVAEVGAARMDEPGPLGARTFKDLSDRLAAGQAIEQRILERAISGERPAPPWSAGHDPERDQDRINWHVHDATQAHPLPGTPRTARATWDRREERLAARPDAALIAPDHAPWPKGRPPRPAVVRAATPYLHKDHDVDVRAWLAGPAATGTAG